MSGFSRNLIEIGQQYESMRKLGGSWSQGGLPLAFAKVIKIAARHADPEGPDSTRDTLILKIICMGGSFRYT
jgi:hypothetical protein